jgi:hypothetical protein
MRKVAFLFFLMGGMCAFAQEKPVPLDDALIKAALDLTRRIPLDSTVVVLNFDAPTERLSDHIVNTLIVELGQSGRLDVVDQQNLEKMLTQIDFENSGYVDDNSAAAFGKIPGVQTIVFGSFKELGNETYRLEVMANQVPTNRRQGTSRSTVHINKQLADYLGIRWVDEGWKDKWLYVGAWAGYGYGFAAGAQLSVQLLRGFALTLDVGAGGFKYKKSHTDTFNSDNDRDDSESATLFTAALFPVFTLRPKPTPLSFEVYGGPYITGLKDHVFGVAVGGSVGCKLGPGILFADFRYGIAHLFGMDMKVAEMMSGGLGYKIGLISKKQW